MHFTDAARAQWPQLPAFRFLNFRFLNFEFFTRATCADRTNSA